MRQIPILILSDCPSQTSGLARITRDIATQLSREPGWRVATLGWQGTGSCRLPFTTYHMQPQEFGEVSLPAVWDEWSRGETGVVFTIWDMTRLLWLSRPENCENQELRSWLQNARRTKFQLWSYVPVDSVGPRGMLTGMVREALLGVDRLLAYTPWGRDVIRGTIGEQESVARGLSWMPHGNNAQTFNLNGTQPSEVTRIGCVMTNQTRKDWGTMAAIAAGLVDYLKRNVRFWWHVDQPVRLNAWNLHALIDDFQLKDYVELTTPPCDDRWLAQQYRQCHLTVLPSLGEGWGFPITESLACGTPCLHTAYGGGASVLETCGMEDLMVNFLHTRIEGTNNCMRPIMSPTMWAASVRSALNHKWDKVELSASVDHLDWHKLWPIWRRWFEEGVNR
jgi:glycosyltransferase involved in cell wall biosynthesis